ncbi:hypothetical protein ACFSTC_30990 [Nonomuraea ferruginea]
MMTAKPVKNSPVVLRMPVPIMSALRSSATASSSGSRSPACQGKPITVGGTGMPAAVSTVGVVSVMMTMSPRRVEAVPSSPPDASARFHMATRRCGTDPWSPMPLSTTWAPAGSFASAAPTSASAARTASRRRSGPSASGTAGRWPPAR